MADDSYGNVSVLVFDPDLTSRKGTAYALNNLGISEIEEHHNLKTLHTALGANQYDLVFLECGSKLSETFTMVRDIRHNRLGANPFVSIMFTLWRSTEQLVTQAMHTGADDVIIKPFSANTVNERVQYQIARRKPFVFRENYSGPVRRASREEIRALAPIEVPNFLRAKARSEPLPPISQTQIDSIIGFQRCKEQQARIDEAVTGLKIYFASPEARDFPIGLVTNLISAAQDLGTKSREGKFFHIVEHCDAVGTLAVKIQSSGVGTDVRDLALLENSAAAIATGLRDRKSATETTHETA